jgi:hypothetical protein
MHSAQRQEGLACQQTGLYILQTIHAILDEKVDNVSNSVERKSKLEHAIKM